MLKIYMVFYIKMRIKSRKYNLSIIFFTKVKLNYLTCNSPNLKNY